MSCSFKAKFSKKMLMLLCSSDVNFKIHEHLIDLALASMSTTPISPCLVSPIRVFLFIKVFRLLRKTFLLFYCFFFIIKVFRFQRKTLLLFYYFFFSFIKVFRFQRKTLLFLLGFFFLIIIFFFLPFLFRRFLENASFDFHEIFTTDTL